MTAKPLISVVIPTFNSGGCLKDTLQSVAEQTGSNFTIIVCDDGSTDNTLEITHRFAQMYPSLKFKILEGRHQGAGAARNKGILAAEGEWVAFIDSDDLWLPEKIEKVSKYILEHPQIEMISHNELIRSGNKELLIESFKIFNTKMHPFLSLYRRNAFGTSAMIVKKEALIRAGLFDETLPSAQDYDLWLRLAPIAGVGFIKEPLSVHIKIPGSLGANLDSRLKCMLAISEKYKKDLKGLVRFPCLEVRRFKGRTYCGIAMALLRQGKKRKGAYFLLKGALSWPFYGFYALKQVYVYLRGFYT